MNLFAAVRTLAARLRPTRAELEEFIAPRGNDGSKPRFGKDI